MRGGLAVAIVASMLTACASPPPAEPPPPPAAAAEPAPAPEPPPAPAPEAPPVAAPEERTYSVAFAHLGGKSLPDPVKIQVEGDYRHEASGAVFPAKAGEIVRTKVTQYDEGAMNVSAGYSWRTGDGPVVFTLYVYPGHLLQPTDAPPEVVAMACKDEANRMFEKELADILRYHEKHEYFASVTSREPVVLKAGGHDHAGMRVALEVDSPLARKGERAESLFHYFAFAGGHWVVKVRTTGPKGMGAAAEVDRLLGALTWPVASR